jgi:hypothetical protein
MRRLLAALIAAGVMLVTPFLEAPVAHAQACATQAFRQYDMAGVYTSASQMMRVEVYPCGGTFVMWDNSYGTHYAGYYSVQRLPGGGIGMRVYPDSPEKLDSAQTLGIKPAEPGYIQVITVSPYGDILGIYRLQKIGNL